MPMQPVPTLPSKRFFLIAVTIMIALFALAIYAQQLQRGVSVQMAVTTSAPSLPDADNNDAWVVTITERGILYFGSDPVTPEGLSQAMRVRPRLRGQELYVKADARVPFASVERVLGIAHQNRFGKVFLLTAQPIQSGTGELKATTMVPPKGLPVWVPPSSAAPVVVYIGASQRSLIVKVNDEQVPPTTLQRKLDQLLDDQEDRVVILQAESVPFRDVAHVLDVCNMASARCVVSLPEL